MSNNRTRLLAISGSLRDVSTNTILLKALIELAPENVEISLYNELGDLPHFNPDSDDENAPLSVKNLREKLKSADGVIISSPEYAHGLPGSLKNALDWLVSSGETVEKPFLILNASPRAHHAQDQLVEILTTMAAKIIDETYVTIPLAGRKLDEFEIIADAELSSLMRSLLVDFIGLIK